MSFSGGGGGLQHILSWRFMIDLPFCCSLAFYGLSLNKITIQGAKMSPAHIDAFHQHLNFIRWRLLLAY